jgi:Bacteriophage head to tail connecting protein
MTDPSPAALIARADALKAERAALEAAWQEIAEALRPTRADFTGAPGARAPLGGVALERARHNTVFDSAPALAADNLAAGLWGMITNSANAWFELRHPVTAINDRQEVRLWLDACTRILRDTFAANGQTFYARVLELYQDLVAFGTAVFYVDEVPPAGVRRGGLHFSCRHLGECLIAENDLGEVDTLYRRFVFTARQAHRRWGDAAGARVARALARNRPDERFEFLHAVVPNDDRDPGRADMRGMGWRSITVAVEDKAMVSESGYHEFPFMVPRWSTSARQVYGDSPALLALADVKMLNMMSKVTIAAAQKSVDPPLLAADERGLRGVRTTPGGIIYGGIDSQGRVRYQPLQIGAQVNLGLEMAEQRRQAIREAFYFSLLLMVSSPNATATEVLAREQEKLRLMGPHLGRIESEFLDPCIDRVFAVLMRSGALPPPPPAVLDAPGLKVEYVSPLARAQRAAEGEAIVRTFEAMAPLLASAPAVVDNFDTDAVARALADAYGMPVRAVRDPAMVAALRAARLAPLAGVAGAEAMR